MTHVAASADKIPSISGFGPIALVIIALGSVTAWTMYSIASVSTSSSSDEINAPSFKARFESRSVPNFLSTDLSRPLLRILPSEMEIKIQLAKDQLAQKLQSQSQRVAFMDEPASSSVAAIPLPRSRPVEANLQLRDIAITAQTVDRTLLQKLSDLFPARITLASHSPDGGLVSDRADLASLGYDNLTAVYDISARTVYMPNGLKLEAHSGLGSLMDDPGHVSERNVGATPPNVYDLKPRERLFHGIQALRMISLDTKGTIGRSGLLAHGYMLGANGDSNGCVSIKDYEKFLRAFNNGEIKRLVVVPSLGNGVPAARRSLSES